MKRAIFWLIGFGLVIALVLLAAVGGLWFWLNRYVQSDAFKRDVEARMTETLGGPVVIETIDFKIFAGIELHHLTFTTGEGQPDIITVKVQKIDCALRWPMLLQRQIELTSVTLHQADFNLHGQPSVVVIAPPSTTPPPDQPANPAPSVPRAESQKSGLSFSFQIDSFYLKDSTIEVQSRSGENLALVQGLTAEADASLLNRQEKITGHVEATQLMFPTHNLQLSHFSTPVTYDHGSVEIKPYEGTIFSGNLAGGYLLQKTGSVLDVNIRGCDVQEVLASLHVSVSLSGDLATQSKWRNIESGPLDGEGDAQLSRGKLLQNSALAQAGQLLGLKGWDGAIPFTSQCHYTVENDALHFTDLDLLADPFRLTGSGIVGFDERVNAHLTLILPAEEMKQLRKEIAASFLQKEDGTGSISFTVTGTTSNPQTDLPTRLLLQNTMLQNTIQNQLDKLFHKK